MFGSARSSIWKLIAHSQPHENGVDWGLFPIPLPQIKLMARQGEPWPWWAVEGEENPVLCRMKFVAVPFFWAQKPPAPPHSTTLSTTICICTASPRLKRICVGKILPIYRIYRIYYLNIEYITSALLFLNYLNSSKHSTKGQKGSQAGMTNVTTKPSCCVGPMARPWHRSLLGAIVNI